MTEEAVRFYTFLRILRDAASPFATLWYKRKLNGQHKRHAENVLISLREAFISARKVLSGDPITDALGEMLQDIGVALQKKTITSTRRNSD
jgi:hypothetical protein